MKLAFFLGLFALLLLLGDAAGQFIEIRVSVKIVVDPETDRWPGGMTRLTIENAEEAANEWKATYFRGYRFRVTEIRPIGGPEEGGSEGPSKWFGIRPSGDLWVEFQNDLNTDGRYLRRTDAVNVYVTTSPQSDGGGECPIPPQSVQYIACHALVNQGPWWLNHELGHFFGLLHTHQGEDRAAGIPGDDGISDTLPDCVCWMSLDEVANHHYGAPYASLTAAQKTLVENSYFNVMSYHEAATKDDVESRMTERQLDRMADVANSDRAPFVSGRTVFLGTSGSDVFPAFGTSLLPFKTLGKSLGVADSGGRDIILIRPGNYDEPMTISKPVTLRAPRSGWVTIGKP